MRKIERMGRLALDNSITLHRDSAALWRRGSFGSAMALSVLAAEELGKYWLLDELVYRSRIDGKPTPQAQEAYLNQLFNHRTKQDAFIPAASEHLPPGSVQRILDGQLNVQKLRGLYVGPPKSGKALSLADRTVAPQYTGKERAARQITYVSDALLAWAAGGASGVIVLDIDEAQSLLTWNLARKLRRAWPRLGKRARAFLGKVAPHLVGRAAPQSRG